MTSSLYKITLYKVTLNWKKEIHVIYTHARNEITALNNACHQLFKKLNLNYSYYRQEFLDKNNFKIEKEKNNGKSRNQKIGK